MEPPECSLCHKKHWAHEKHKFVKDKSTAVKDKVKYKPPNVKDKRADVKDKPPVKDVLNKNPVLNKSRSTNWQRNNREKYNAYMKDYMAKRRKRLRET